jgi:hypothetical protein
VEKSVFFLIHFYGLVWVGSLSVCSFDFMSGLAFPCLGIFLESQGGVWTNWVRLGFERKKLKALSTRITSFIFLFSHA